MGLEPTRVREERHGLFVLLLFYFRPFAGGPSLEQVEMVLVANSPSENGERRLTRIDQIKSPITGF